jgi:L-2-hydroxyglutarate oxidase LhgO
MIYIIGAGWYGCHIASELLKTQNVHNHEIRLVDKANAFFTGSSARNQNRLHLGYHYPRSLATIAECKQGFAEFKARYPTLSTPIPNNLYLIATQSQTSAEEFSRRFDHPGELLCVGGRTPFSRIRGTKLTMFQVAEEYIDNEAAALYFWDLLSPHFACE